MPANVNNARHFKLTTDFPLDKVIYLHSGSADVPSLSSTPILIPHGLPFIPLVGGSWDTTPTFETNYDYYTGTIPSTNSAYLFNLEFDISADATNVIITPNPNLTGGTVTVYYRIYAFEPSDSSANLEPTASSGSSFILNTDNNYTKLYMEGVISSPASLSTTTIFHNLGYKPQVVSWWTYAGVLQPVSLLVWNFGDPYPVAVEVNDLTIDFVLGVSSVIDRIDYRIYLDETGNGI